MIFENDKCRNKYWMQLIYQIHQFQKFCEHRFWEFFPWGEWLRRWRFKAELLDHQQSNCFTSMLTKHRSGLRLINIVAYVEFIAHAIIKFQLQIFPASLVTARKITLQVFCHPFGTSTCEIIGYDEYLKYFTHLSTKCQVVNWVLTSNFVSDLETDHLITKLNIKSNRKELSSECLNFYYTGTLVSSSAQSWIFGVQIL